MCSSLDFGERICGSSTALVISERATFIQSFMIKTSWSLRGDRSKAKVVIVATVSEQCAAASDRVVEGAKERVGSLLSCFDKDAAQIDLTARTDCSRGECFFVRWQTDCDVKKKERRLKCEQE